MAMTPKLSEIFVAFLAISLSAFGGTLPWARRVLVDQRRWMKPDEFMDTLALCQFLPGPNIVNLSIAVGARFRGPLGALTALLGLVLAPFCIVIALGALYGRFGNLDSLRGLFAGIAAAAAGLIIAMTARMAAPLLRTRALSSLPLIIAAFVMVALLNWPLPWVLLGLAPISVALSARDSR
jgi:chromate transporter